MAPADVHRMRSTELLTPTDGRVRLAPAKAAWIVAHTLLGLVGGAATISADAAAVFLVTTVVTLCLGHSLGMHRLLIHRSYRCGRALELTLVWLGTLVGMAGPLGMVRTHDLRDWAHRQPACHPLLRHGTGVLRDAYWQLCCEVELAHPPRFVPERRLAEDRTITFLERTWMLQQLPPALVLFTLGGWAWVFWGVHLRIAVSLIGHWLVGHYAHQPDAGEHAIVGAAVQGRNVSWAGALSMGEAWHDNHHAWPGSARLGLYPGQSDPGWWVLRGLARVGLVRDLVLPEDLPPRPERVPRTERARALAGEASVD